jgi:hypothetical protein
MGFILALAIGCERPRNPHTYTVLSGTVLSRHSETGELLVELSPTSAHRFGSDRIQCVVTKDSEIYINDVFRTLEDIQLGDPIELIGYRESERRLERFVVTLARSEHPLPPPALPPELSAPAPADEPQTQPTQTARTEPPSD